MSAYDEVNEILGANLPVAEKRRLLDEILSFVGESRDSLDEDEIIEEVTKK